MNRKGLVGLFKANLPQFVWMSFPVYIGSFIYALEAEDKDPEWVPITLFLITVTILVSIAEFANTYADRDEDWLYVPSNPIVTGELDAGTARKAFIVQNILGGAFLIALLAVTRNYWLTLALAIGWAVGYTYSMPPFRFKERVVGPLFFALGISLKPIVGWLVIGPLNDFMIGFAVFLFIWLIAFQISGDKLRKTAIALNHGIIQSEGDSGVHSIGTVGLKLTVKTAIFLESFIGLGAFILVPIFWHLDIFNMTLSIALLTLPLVFMILTVVTRIREPLRNADKCGQLIGMVYSFIILSFCGVALANVIHWALAALICIIFLIVFRLLFRIVHPFGEASRIL